MISMVLPLNSSRLRSAHSARSRARSPENSPRGRRQRCHHRVNIQTGCSHRQQTDRREHRETAADVIRHNKGLVASSSASFLSAPRSLSVVAKMRSRAPSLPYLLSHSFFSSRKAMAGSVVVPDFEMTLMQKSRSPIILIMSFK